jgi:hypothetical protein
LQAAPLQETLPAPDGAIVVERRYVFAAQDTLAVTLAVSIVPVPLETVQVWPMGCWPTVTP